jgi:hypothetical protein
MKQGLCVIAALSCITACNKGPTVELHNATGNQVATAVKQSGVMSSDTMVEPGLWQSKVTVQEMNIPGLPAQYAEKMKQTMAEHRNQASSHCVTAADVRRPKEDFFGGDKSCRYEHFTMGGGKIDIEMICKEEGASQTTRMAGSYTPTSYSMDVASQGTGEGAQNGTSMKMHVDSQRVGECSGKVG